MDPVVTTYLFSKLADLGVTATGNIFKAYQKRVKKHEEDEQKVIRAVQIEKSAAIMQQGIIGDLLTRVYSPESLGAEGYHLPTILMNGNANRLSTAVRREFFEMDMPLSPQNERFKIVKDETPQVLDPRFLSTILADIAYWKLNVWDQPIYSLKRVATDGETLQCDFSIDNFMRFRYSFGALWNESIQSLIDADLDVCRIIQKQQKFLPIRTHYLRDSRSLCNFGNRLCAGGIHATVAIARESDFAIPLQSRSISVSDGQSALAVVPSGYHQPLSEPGAELDLSLTFKREFFEELLGGEEVERRTNRLQYDWFVRASEPLRWFTDNPNKWQLRCSGLLLNLAQGNYDVPLLCVIKDVEYWRKFGDRLAVNWESTENIYPLVSSLDKEAIKALLLRKDWIPSSLYSFCAALRHLKREYSEKVDIPEFRLDISN